jgi:hypothetical protein
MLTKFRRTIHNEVSFKKKKTYSSSQAVTYRKKDQTSKFIFATFDI